MDTNYTIGAALAFILPIPIINVPFILVHYAVYAGLLMKVLNK